MTALEQIQKSGDFIELLPSESVSLDLRYASPNNFTGVNLYGDFNRAFLHRVAYEKFQRAIQNLRGAHPGYRFLVFDTVRTRTVQRILWNKVVGTPQQDYVADPALGSLHNYGLAIDLTVLDAHGRELDMGTPFDDFTALAQPQNESQLRADGKLSEAQLRNRLILRTAMTEAGFIVLPVEWWHFNAIRRSEITSDYRVIE
jgi:D-alanyl-D-alanine dipeptidase